MTGNFVTVTRTEEATWADLADPIVDVLTASFE